MAIEHMHSRGYVHCDIKPKNAVLLDKTGWSGAQGAAVKTYSTPKLIDFGTAIQPEGLKQLAGPGGLSDGSDPVRLAAYKAFDAMKVSCYTVNYVSPEMATAFAKVGSGSRPRHCPHPPHPTPLRPAPHRPTAPHLTA